jgi:hypothetical protein
MKSKYGSQLYLRHLSNELPPEDAESHLKEYALYRYGGKMKLSKDNFESQYEPGILSDDFHPTYNELLSQIETLAADKKNEHVMKQLKLYYEQSAINSVAGPELQKIKRVRPC